MPKYRGGEAPSSLGCNVNTLAKKSRKRGRDTDSDSDRENHGRDSDNNNSNDESGQDPMTKSRHKSSKKAASRHRRRSGEEEDDDEENGNQNDSNNPAMSKRMKAMHEALLEVGVKKTTSKAAILEEFKTAGCLMPQAVTPFHNLVRAFQVGLRMGPNGQLETDDSIEDMDEDERAELEYLKTAALAAFPALDNYIQYYEDTEDVEMLHSILDFIDFQGRHARTDDIGNLRYAAINYIPDIPGIPRMSATNRNKSDRGFAHIASGRLLCPRNRRDEFDQDREKFCRDVREGNITVDAFDWPSFLYPEDGYDPHNIDAGLLRGPFLLACYRHIFTGPRTAMKATPGPAAGKKPIADIYQMVKVAPRTIAYTAVLARFILNGQEEWSVEDGDFDSITFFNNIVKLFDETEEDPEWTEETLTWWNSQVLGAKSRRGARITGHAKPQSGTSLLAAQRAARRVNQNS